MGQITASGDVLEYVNGTDLVVFDNVTRSTHLLEAPTSLVYQVIRKEISIPEELIGEICGTANIEIGDEELESVLENLSEVNLIERTM